MSDNVPCVQEYADVEAEDDSGRTPLLLAASKAATRCLHYLIGAGGANAEHRDADGRNFVHLAVLNGSRLCDLAALDLPHVRRSLIATLYRHTHSFQVRT